MKLEGQSKNHLGMRSADKLMRDHFKDTINLVNYWGPVQMCVFYLEYMYLPSKYKIMIECERGFITIQVTDEDGKRFSPWMVYPGTNYYHYEDRISDIEELVELTYQAIAKEQITFLNNKEISELGITFFDK